MKKIKNVLKLDLLVYKLVGIILIAGYLFYVNSTYFATPKYGNTPFFIVVLFVCSLHLLLPYILDKIISSILLAFYAIYLTVQVCYCKMFEQYLYLGSALSLYNEAKDYASDGLALLTRREKTVLIAGIIVILILCLLRRKKDSRHKKKVVIGILTAALGFCGVAALSVKETKAIASSGTDLFAYNESDLFIYDKVNPKKTFVELFGIEQFLFRDIKDNYLVNESKIEEENQMVADFLAENLEYQENEMTGLLEGKHLLLIEAESLNMAAIDEELTPTLYRLLTEGWFFDNFYSPLLTGSTSDVETMVNTSLIPIDNGEIVSQSYAENEYPVTLAKAFKAAGYTVEAIHNNYQVYYNRENYFPSLGYDTFLDSFGLGVENQSSDYICGQILNWIPVFNDLDFTFWITYSGHQPYDPNELNNYDQYPEAVQEEYAWYMSLVEEKYPDLDPEVKVYLAKNISLDFAIESYIQTYEMMGQSEKLVIVFYGDHYAKGFSEESKKKTEEILGRSLVDTPLVLWYPGIEAKVIEKYCTDIDLLPTILNLYNVPYDKTKVLGNDVFDERYHGFQFTTTWVIHTDDYVYYLETGEFDDLKISEEEARADVERYLKYQEISNIIFQNNYFAEENE